MTAAGIVGLLLWQTNSLLTDQVMTSLKAEVAELRSVIAQGGVKAVADAINARSRPEGPGLYFLSDNTGQKLAGNLNRMPPELANNAKGGVFRYEGPAGASDAPRMAVAMPVHFADGTDLVVGRDIEDQRALAARMRRVFLYGFGLLSLAGLAGALGAGRLLLQRIEAINATSRSIMAGDLARRIPLSGAGDEIDGLAQNLNAMLERIEHLMAGLREVSDNIAHDLKTPLNRLRNRAEAALRDGAGTAAYRDGLERTIEDADELIKTFNALLLIARLEAGALEKSGEPFDLGSHVRDVAEFYEPVAEEAGIALTVEAGEGPEVIGNRQLVGQAIANLIDNAIKYGRREAETGSSAAATSIRVAVSVESDAIVISVADNGPGIGEKDRERALRRFVRLEESRTKPGTGLGLSLVAAVARLHGGTVELADNGPGLKVMLRLPLPKV